jgi:phenylpropionate dioxygenase-like ring-hydroxylating dioxygenase large terminal subunit
MDLSLRLINSYWHPLCHASELAEDKDFVRFNLLDFEVVAYNDKGTIIAFDNLCPHRGARFFLDDFGRSRIKCEYHGWSFIAGQAKIPKKEEFINCDIGSAALNQFKVARCGDFIFFSPTAEQNLQQQLGAELVCRLESISQAIKCRSDFNRYPFESYWPIAVENALEPDHIPMIHGDSLAPLRLQAGENIYYGENSIWLSPLGNNAIDEKLVKLGKFFEPAERYPGYMSIYIFPFAMISSTHGYSYSMQNFFPGDRTKTFFTSRLYQARESNPRYDEMVKSLMLSSASTNRAVFDEDHTICKRIPAKTWSTDNPKYYGQHEEKIIHFRQSCRRWVDD